MLDKDDVWTMLPISLSMSVSMDGEQWRCCMTARREMGGGGSDLCSQRCCDVKRNKIRDILSSLVHFLHVSSKYFLCDFVQLIDLDGH